MTPTNAHPPAERPRRLDRAFTLVEMLVTIAIITILLGIVLPVLSGVSAAGRQTKEMAAGRQLMVAYRSYATDNRDMVMPGYLSGLKARDQRGRDVADLTVEAAAARYPYRIAPYLAYDFRGLYSNGQEQRLEEWEHLENDFYRVYFRSLAPSLGLNATWMGGSEDFGLQDDAWTGLFGRFWVEGMSEVRRPTELMVFCSARGVDPLAEIDGVVEGYFEVRSPRLTVADDDRWEGPFDSDIAPEDWGFVSPRYGGEAVSVFVDGHVDTLVEDELRNMRHWANRADTADFALEPR